MSASCTADRLNVFPDGVELVFVDDDEEYNNPLFIAWLILGDSADKTLLSKLCDPPHPGTQSGGAPSNFLLGHRAYANTSLDNKTFSAINCVPVPPTPTHPKNYKCTVNVQ